MKTVYKYLKILSLSALVLPIVWTCNEDTVETDLDALRQVFPPSVTSFSPASGPVGTVITIIGDNLGSIDSVWIGGVKAMVKNRVSQELLVAEVTVDAKSGKIKVQNRAGTAESSSNFTMEYAIPVLTDYPTAATVTETVLLKGANFQSVSAVYFAGTKAQITTHLNSEMLVTVPPLPMSAGDDVDISLAYYTASGIETTGTTGAPVHINRVYPEFTNIPNKGNAESMVTVLGDNLSIIEHVILDTAGMPVPLVIPVKTAAKTFFSFELPDTLTFVITNPTSVRLRVMYYETNEELLNDNFVINIPGRETVYFWENITMECQVPDAASVFFVGSTGRTYDPCQMVANVDGVSTATDFYTVWSGNGILISNPTNGTGYTQYRCEGVALPSGGSKNVMFRFLNETPTTTPNAAEAALAEIVRNQTIIKITPDLWDGVRVPAMSAPRAYPPHGSTGSNPFVEGTIMMFQEFQAGAPVKTGFIEVVKLTFPEDISTTALAARSTITMNIYYEK
ncbi:MAG: IPT/TIG domain-containing protein [Bacteroidales bacterium]|nr:IPT/TIG domain-containing protein [Bacteroidales bacterium]MCL2133496.1 IPT/TIG domain-containing protein [Bacteroidales bacterium]